MQTTDPSRLDLYKARYKKWRATPATPEWHRACAVIRAYNGDSLSAWMHEFLASFSEAVNAIAEAWADAFRASSLSRAV